MGFLIYLSVTILFHGKQETSDRGVIIFRCQGYFGNENSSRGIIDCEYYALIWFGCYRYKCIV